jgi:methyl-accepting chemotaxis protein
VADPNSPAQLDLVQQMNKLLQEQNTIMQQIADSMGKSAAAFQQVNSAANQVSDSTKNATDKSKELTQAMKENTGGSEGLSAAMGKQTQSSNAAGKSFKGLAEAAGDVTTVMGALAAAQSAIGSGFAAVGGVVNLFFDGISSGIGIIKGAVGVIGGFFSGLMQAAADYRNATAGQMHQANETLRKDMGDITSDQGKFVKDMAGNLGTAKKALGAAGGSLYASIGNSAAVLQEMTAMAGEFGDSLVRMQGQIDGATSELLLMRKGMNISTEAFKNIASSAEASGGTMKDALTETMVASAHLSKTFGVDVKVIGKNIDKMAKDMGSFGSMAPKELAAVATYATKLGVSIEALKGTMDAFDTFEGAAANAGKLAEAFGMNVDVMGMMNAENPAERMDMLRKSFEETGRSVNDLSRHEMKLLSESMGGLPVDEMKNALSMSTDEMGFGDFESAAEEAAEKMTPEQAMKDVAKSIDKLALQIKDMTAGPLSEFLRGFTQAITRSAEFRAIMKDVTDFLLVFFELGKEVGRMFVETFLKKGGDVRNMIDSIFSLEKITKFSDTVKAAFEQFKTLIKVDPKEAIENLFDSVLGAFKDWFGSGEQANSLGSMLAGLLENGFKMLAGLAPKIIKTAAGYIQTFATSLKEFLNGDSKTANEIGSGIGGAFMMAFDAISDSLVDDLLPVLLDLFGVLFEKFAIPATLILSGIFALIFAKAMISSVIAVGAGALVKGLATKIASYFGNAMPDVPGPDGDSPNGGNTKSAIEGLKDFIKGMLDIKATAILEAGFKLLLIAAFLGGALAIFAGAIWLSAKILEKTSWSSFGKAIISAIVGVMSTVALVAATKLMPPEGEMLKAAIGLVGAAALYTVGVVAFAWAISYASSYFKDVSWKEFSMTMIAVTAGIAGTVVLIVAGLILSSAAAGIPAVLLGLLGAALIFTVGVVAFAIAIRIACEAMKGVEWGTLGITLAALGAGMLAAGVMIGFGALLGTPFGLAAIGFAALGLPAAAGLFSIGVVAFAVALFAMMKAVSSLNMKKVKAVLEVMGVVVDQTVKFAHLGAMFGSSFFFGIEGMSKGVKKLATLGVQAFKEFAEVIKVIDKLPIKDPKMFQLKMDAIGKLIKATQAMGEMGLDAAKMSMAAQALGGNNAQEMMNSISTFVTGTIDSMKNLIVSFATMASGMDENALKGAGAIAGIIAAVAGLAGALIGPMTELQAQDNAAWLGTDSSEQISALGTGISSILAALNSSLAGPEGLIAGLISATDLITNPDEFLKKAQALEAAFKGIAAIAEVTGKLWVFAGTQTKWFASDSEESILDDMFGALADLMRSDGELYRMVQMTASMLNTIKFPDAAITDAFSAGVDAMIKMIETVAGLGKFLSDGGLLGLMNADDMLWTMRSQMLMPSDILWMVSDEAYKIASIMGDMDADLGTLDLRPSIAGVLGFDGDRTFTIKPEAVNLTVRLAVKIDAEDLAVAISKGNADLDGFFQTTAKAKKADLDIPAGL